MPVTSDAINNFENSLLALDRLQVKRILQEMSASRTPMELMEELIAPALERIGESWEKGTVALSQVYMSRPICEELVESILPKTGATDGRQPKIAIAVLEDYHLLGKRIVYSALRASGFQVLDLGHGLSVDEVCEKCVEEKIEILLISVLMLPSALAVKEVASRLRKSIPGIRIVVGGAPFKLDKELWRQVDADAVGYNSGEAINIVSQLVSEEN